jgi:hypothetical protein
MTLWSVGIPQRAAWVSISHDLRAFAECVIVNVGGPCGEGCSPPMNRMGVGGVIDTQRMGKPSTQGRTPGD